MERIEHTGRAWSCSFLTGRETRKVFRYVDKVSGEQVNGVGSFIGRLRDVDSGEDVAQLRCSWCENGDIEVVFPDMGVGRYVIVIDHSGLNGEITRFLDGFAGYLEPRYAIDGYLGGEDVVVTVCCGDGAHEVYALSGDLLKYSTLEAIEAMKAAEAARDAVLDKLDLAMEFVASFNKALLECVQVVNDYLWIGGVNTGHKLKGNDGETPRYGSDGWWYIGDERVGQARGDDGITPHITSDGYWAFGSQKTNVRAAGKDGINGAAMRRVLIQSLDELPQTEERGVYYYLKDGEHYDVYVWLEPDGWVCVGEANDIATSEVYGLVKLGTDMQVDNGAPVGRDVDGQMSVPLAGTAVAGAGKLSTNTQLSDGGLIGLNSSKQLMVHSATTGVKGAVKLSTSDVVDDGGFIGESSSGQMRVKQAAAFTWGVVKVGTSVPQSMGLPWIIPVGKAADGIHNEYGQDITGQLLNNTLVGGALRTATKNTWLDWSPQGIDVNVLPDGSNAVGLMTSNQFSQSAANGLELLPATTSMIAGVRLARSMQDDEEAAVLTAPIVRTWVMGYAPSRSEVYTISQSDARFLTMDRADSLYLRKEDVSDYAVKNGAESETTIYRMTKAQFDALGTRDGNGIYFIKRS